MAYALPCANVDHTPNAMFVSKLTDQRGEMPNFM